MKQLKEDVKQILNNHLPHIYEELKQLHKATLQNTIDMQWLKRGFWVIATASIATLISVLFK